MTRSTEPSSTGHEPSTTERAPSSGVAGSAEPRRDPDPDLGRYRIQTVARMTGLGASLLRQWERRHGLVRPARGHGGYRQYSQEDVDVFRRARELLASGLTIGEVARLGRERLLSDSILGNPPKESRGGDPKRDRRLDEKFLRAARRGDVREMAEMIARSINGQTLDGALEEFLQPALGAIGDLWERGQLGPGTERLGTNVIRGALEAMLVHANVGLGALAAICAPGAGDMHELGALMVSLKIARAGFRSIHLSGPLQTEHLIEAVRTASPRVLCLSYVRSVGTPQLLSQVRELKRSIPRGVVMLAGGGAVRDLREDLEAIGVRAPRDFEEVSSIVGARMRGHDGPTRIW